MTRRLVRSLASTHMPLTSVVYACFHAKLVTPFLIVGLGFPRETFNADTNKFFLFFFLVPTAANVRTVIKLSTWVLHVGSTIVQVAH